MFTTGFVAGTYFTVSSFIKTLYAADAISATWEIDTAGEYSLSDATKIEVAASSARLSVQNYIPDSNTKLLLHLDESSGTPVDSATPSGTATPTGLSYVSGQLNNAGDFNGTSSQVSMVDSSNLSLSGSHSLEAWAKLDNSFGASSHGQKQGILDKGDYRLYFDQTSGKVVYELGNSASTTWTQQAGNDIKNSWDLNGKNYIRSSVVDSSNNVYVGLGNAVSDAEVWKWNGTTWSQIGGDGDNGSWQDQQDGPRGAFVQGLQHLHCAGGAGLVAVDLELLMAVRDLDLQRQLDAAQVFVHRTAEVTQAGVVGWGEAVSENQADNS